jgi:hypothetical protein
MDATSTKTWDVLGTRQTVSSLFQVVLFILLPLPETHSDSPNLAECPSFHNHSEGWGHDLSWGSASWAGEASCSSQTLPEPDAETGTQGSHEASGITVSPTASTSHLHSRC